MKMSLPIVHLLLLLVKPKEVRGDYYSDKMNSMPEGFLNSFSGTRKFTELGPEETKDLVNYEDAQAYCHGKLFHGSLAAQWEWCLHPNADDPFARGVWGGIRDSEQWVPIRHWAANFNNWLLIGPLGGTDYSKVCRTYHDIYPGEYDGEHDWPEKITIAEEEENLCFKPTDCNGNKCPMDCKLRPEGYYPSGEDCHSFCYCAGDGTGYWETITGNGKVWDPWCKDSTPLDPHNVPLGGMTGGCSNDELYLEDRDAYCSPSIGEYAATSSIYVGKGNGKGPIWGETEVKLDFANTYVACQQTPLPPKQPKTCSDVWGDPHIITWDGLKYDYQGIGEFILSKSLDSGFQLQGRFFRNHKVLDWPISTLHGFVIETGYPGEPRVEATIHNWASPTYVIDGKVLDLPRLYHVNGTIATGTEKVHYINWGHNSYFHFPGSGISVRFRIKHQSKIGVYMDIRICLTDDMLERERIVGMFGSPDEDQRNDWMKNDGKGTVIEHDGDTEWKKAHDYVRENWCIREKKDSLFSEPGYTPYPTKPDPWHHCDDPYDPKLEEKVKEAPPGLQKICAEDPDCLLEGTVTDNEDHAKGVGETKRVLYEERPELKPSPSSSGDPHFKTWTGEKYDFHGECDLVLIENPDFANGLGLHVHIRTKIDTWWSFIETAAVRLGDHTLEITGGKKHIPYWLDGNKVEDMKTGDSTLGDFAVHFKRHSEHQTVARIDLGNGNALSIETYKRFVRVNFKTSGLASEFNGSYGMLGSYPGGQKVARDMKTLITNPNKFGQEWQVLPTDPNLFHESASVQHPQQCKMPTETQKSERRRRLSESTISKGEAAMACGGVKKVDRDSCIFDVLATQTLDIAGSY